MKTIKIEIVPTDRTDLLCIRCGMFRTDYAVQPSPGAEQHVGVHAACLREARGQSAVRSHYIERPQLPPSGLRVAGDGLEVTSLADGAFPTPSATATVTADGVVRVINEYGEPIPFKLVPVEDESPLDREERELRHALALATD
jgi:hypothetical protein